MTDHDPHLWLEDVDSDAALDWVGGRSEATLSDLGSGDRAEAMFSEALEILDADDRIPWPVLRGRWAYNVWRDGEHPRGLWRRIPRDAVESWSPGSQDSQWAASEWEVLLDVDALAEEEDVNWVYSGTTVRRPADDRALVRLSRGGADAVELREYDLEGRRLRDDADAFRLAECKCSASWLEADTLLLSAALGEDVDGTPDTTDSGYARTVRLWRRGTDPAAAPVLFSGESEDVAVGASVDAGTGRVLFSRALDFHHSEYWFVAPGSDLAAAGSTPDASAPVRIAVPTDCDVVPAADHLLAVPRSAMTVTTRSGEQTVDAGSVIAFEWGDIEATPDRLPTGVVLFEPTATTVVDGVSLGRSRLVLTLLDDVQTRLEAWNIPAPGDAWTPAPLAGLPRHSSIDVVACDRHSTGPAGDTALLAVSGPVTPTDLLALEADGSSRRLAASPERFDASGMTVEQHKARSDDGTEVPYTVLRPAGPVSPGPTILYGYGGFEIAMRPAYAGLRGRLWVERGGTYVVAGIRGGGEYGPEWHQAALREKRPRAFEDFAAVARDLVDRGYCRREQLGTTGGSNGGLLMGVMLTRYPELFAAVCIAVPLLDMRRYHLLLAGASWTAEYGDPESDDWDDFLGAYSPYQNVAPASEREYPPVLMMTSTRDDRVHPGHARKMTAALEASGHEVAYYENVEGGHSGAADNTQEARKAMLTYEFFWRRLGD